MGIHNNPHLQWIFTRPASRLLSVTAILLLPLCSCTTRTGAGSRLSQSDEVLPPTVAMNEDAGRGNEVMVTVRLEDGKKLPVVLDTCAEVTVLDKSLEPRFGKPIATGTLNHFGVVSTNLVFAMPKFYLGNVLLRADTNSVIETSEMKQLLPGEPRAVKGFLGMDILCHYCIQFDFQKRQIHFFSPKNQKRKEWGRPFPLYCIRSPGPVIWDNLAGKKGVPSLVDTGFNEDGWLIPELFNQWTNQTLPARNGEFRAPAGGLGGDIYHDLDLESVPEKAYEMKDPEINVIGLHVLSENLVTFDFPNRVMYLKRVSAMPLVGENNDAKIKPVVESAFAYFRDLKSQGRLPGFSKTEGGNLMAEGYDSDDDSETMRFQTMKKGEPFIYYYWFNRKNGGKPWQLVKAWETDQNGNVITNFSLVDGQK